MQAVFQTLLGIPSFIIDFIETDTVLDIKKKIALEKNIASPEEIKIVLEGKVLLDDTNFAMYEPEKQATFQLIVNRANYLMLDHGGVLDGEFTMNEPDSNDLLLQNYEEGGFQVLKNGVQIVKNLNELVDKYGYRIVFHSKNKEKDQIAILNQLQSACLEKSMIFPKVYAMAICDSDRFVNIDSLSPATTLNEIHGIKIAGYAKQLDGKACVRNALSALLNIPDENRENHVVFDDAPSVIETARLERYSGYVIGNSQGVSLNDAIQEILIGAKTNSSKLARTCDSSIFTKPNTLFFKLYPNLPIEFRQFLSERTENERHKLGHISTEKYWNQLVKPQREELIEKFQNLYKMLTESQKKYINEISKSERKFGDISVEEYWNQLNSVHQTKLLEQYRESKLQSQNSCVIS